MFRCSWQHICLVSTAVVVACLFPPQRASGWSESGHKVIANIAYDRLDPVVRAKIVKVLKRHDDFEMRFKNKMPLDIQKSNQEDQDRWIFLQASIWPDLIRSQSKYHRPTWHFVNQPLFLSEHDEMVLAASIKPNVDPVLPDPLTTAGRDQLNCVQALKLCVRELSDADNSDSERAIYFCWLLHLGGDTHQPCHSTSLVSRARFNKSSGDRGGNLINIKQGKNLHGFWDGLMGSSQSLNDIRGRAVAILASAEVSTAATTASKKLKFED